MHSCDNLTRFNPTSPPPSRRIRIEKFLSFINDRTFIFKQRRSTVRRSEAGAPSKLGTAALQNQKVFFCFFHT